jgi:DNA-directed RNA polymerase sigma subunit (sigma70/sigma32)
MTHQAKDYRLQIRIKNNRIMELVENAGYESLQSFCRAKGLSYQTTGALIRLKLAAINKRTGEPRRPVLKLAKALGVFWRDLFNEDQMAACFDTVLIERKMDAPEMLALEDMEGDPALLIEDHCDDRILSEQLVKNANLLPRYEKVLRLRFGLAPETGAHTFKEVGEIMGCSLGRAQQINAIALRRIKWASKVEK